MQETELRENVKAWVRNHSRLAEAGTMPILDDTDLLATGLLDSLGFVQLMAHVEETTGLAIDLDGVEPEQFTSISGFCKLALAGSGRVG